MDEVLNINNDNDDKIYYIMLNENQKIDVYLIEKKNNYTFNKYLLIICKREELNKLGKLKIFCNNNPSFKEEIELNKKERRIIEIKLKNKIVSFVPIFDDDAINNEEFLDSEDLNEYKDHIGELINKKIKLLNDKKFGKKICITLGILFIILIIIEIVICTYIYSLREMVIREKEDDPQLGLYIYIRDKEYKIQDNDKVKIYYNNGNLKYIGPLKNFEADGKGKYYSKDYKNIIIYNGNFEKGYPNGYGTRYYYEEMNEKGFYNGTWINSKRSGNGKMYYSNGDYYIGNFKDDAKEGKGAYYYNDGDYYIGEFKNDVRHGKGKVYSLNNEIRCEGIFFYDEYQLTSWEYIKSMITSEPHCY